MNEPKNQKNKLSNRPYELANNFAKRAYKLIKAKNLRNIIDLGCGDGRDSIYFYNRGLNVTAFDFSEISINKPQSQVKGINYIIEDIRNINFKENTFDVIYAHLSLQYFDDEATAKIFEKLYRILKKDGYIFIKCKSTQDYLCGKGEKIGENMWKEGLVRHFFTKEFMTESLKNFRVIRIRKTSSVYFKYKSAFIEVIATK